MARLPQIVRLFRTDLQDRIQLQLTGSMFLSPYDSQLCNQLFTSRRLAGAYQLDSVSVTAASGATCAVPIVWELGSGCGVVWFKAMFMGLGIKSPSFVPARSQIRQRGGRLSTAVERQLLHTVPDPDITANARSFRNTTVVSIDAACQWLRDVDQEEAADQLCQHQQPVPAAASSPTNQQTLHTAALMAERGVHVAAADLQALPSERRPRRAQRNPVANRKSKAGQETALKRLGRCHQTVRSCCCCGVSWPLRCGLA